MSLPIGFAIAGVTLASLVHHVPSPERSPVASAAVAGDVAAVRAALAAGADPNAVADHGFTPLDWAARFGQIETMKALVDAGAALDLRDEGPNGWTPIMHALHKGQARAALALLEWGADPDSRSDNGQTPLMRAACEDVPEVVRALLARGADPRATTEGGTNVLTFAVNGCNSEIVRAIRVAAPDEQVSNDLNGFLARMTACLRCRSDVLPLLRN